MPTDPSSPQSIERRIRQLVSISAGFIATVHNTGTHSEPPLVEIWPSTGRPRIGQFDILIIPIDQLPGLAQALLAQRARTRKEARRGCHTVLPQAGLLTAVAAWLQPVKIAIGLSRAYGSAIDARRTPSLGGNARNRAVS